MLNTRFTKLVGCRHPLQQAGMGWIAGPELATAVAEAGGLGMLAMPMVPAQALSKMLESMLSRTSGCIGVTFPIPFLDVECVPVAARLASVVEFSYGQPDAHLVRLVHAGGAQVCWQIGSVAEAVAAVEVGCDLIVAQGTEAGGHLSGDLPLFPLLAQVLETISGVPVLAAGGIGSPRAVAAALAAGADGVRVGTRFVATCEANAHPRYAQALVQAHAEDTVVTTAFSTMWPDAPHRVLAASIAAAEALTDEVVAEVTIGGATIPIPRLAIASPTRTTTGAIEAMPFYAGQGVDAVQAVQPAAEVVRELVDGAERLLGATCCVSAHA